MLSVAVKIFMPRNGLMSAGLLLRNF